MIDEREPLKLVKPTPVDGASGEVYVSIKIDREGKVVFAEVDPKQSSIDVELKQKARSAALASRFSPDDHAHQSGVIVYLFSAY